MTAKDKRALRRSLIRQGRLCAWLFTRYSRAIARASAKLGDEDRAHRAAIASLAFARAIDEWNDLAGRAIRGDEPVVLPPSIVRQFIGIN